MNQPVTLSPDEFQMVMNDLASRDPVLRFLMQKQQQAQEQAASEEKPMRVVGGAA
jgi:hypothetical protein